MNLHEHLETVRSKIAGGDDHGQVTSFVLGVMLALWLFAGIVIDGGLTLAGKARAMDVAQEAARTGAQQLDLGRLRSTDVAAEHGCLGVGCGSWVLAGVMSGLWRRKCG